MLILLRLESDREVRADARLKTGVGVLRLSAVMECADAAHGVGGHIMADGGITCPGDMAKSFGGGADFVMMGVSLRVMTKIRGYCRR